MSEEVNLEVRADESTLLIKYTGANASSRRERHFARIQDSPLGSGCWTVDGDIVLSGFPIPEWIV